MVIKKLGSELKPGDIITRTPGSQFVQPMAVRLLFVRESHISVIERTITVVYMDSPFSKPETICIQPTAEYEVEAPNLTPTQQHAEELAKFVRHVAKNGGNRVVKGTLAEEACELLAKIDPPVPPTREEALAALHNLAEGARNVMLGQWDKTTMQADREKAIEIIDRARKTGVM